MRNFFYCALGGVVQVTYVLSEVIEMDDVARVSFLIAVTQKEEKSLPAILAPPSRSEDLPLISYLFIGLSYHKRHSNCAGVGLDVEQSSSLTHHTMAWSFDSYSITDRKSGEDETS